ncbi:MAG: flagellar motor switch protein FliM [Mariniblastus sp.]|jgi:flagellar motor switch protein FliM
MSQPQYQVYDFASSSRVGRPCWLAFQAWLTKSADLFVEQWSNFSATTIQVIPRSIDADEFETLQSKWTQPAYGVEVGFNDDATTGLLVTDRKQLLRLLMDILGNTSTDEIEDRALTSIEKSLCRLIFEQAASVLGQGWPDQQTLTFSLGQPDDQPNRSRKFAPNKTLLISGFQIQIGEASVDLQLLLAKDETCALMGVDLQAQQLNPNNKISQENIADICVQITAGLGSSELAMNDLVDMSVGDIIVLDQFIEQPLTVYANEKPIFKAWPGRQDQQQVLSIESTIN